VHSDKGSDGSEGLSGIHVKTSSIDNYDLDCVNKTET
jgi:hypothetical protein